MTPRGYQSSLWVQFQYGSNVPAATRRLLKVRKEDDEYFDDDDEDDVQGLVPESLRPKPFISVVRSDFFLVFLR